MTTNGIKTNAGAVINANDASNGKEINESIPRKVRNTNVSRCVSSVPISTSAVDNMNLRTRPLKAVTADISTIGDTLVSSDGGGNEGTQSPSQQQQQHHQKHQQAQSQSQQARRTGNRRRSYQNQRQPFIEQTSKVDNVDKSHLKRASSSSSIRNFFPLQTIGSVCELFRSQICPDSLSNYSHDVHHSELYYGTDGTDRMMEPNLALLSIVIGIIEQSLTNGTFSHDDEDSLLTSVSNVDDSVKTNNGLLTSNSGNRNHNHNENNNGSGGYSPAEATTAPNVGSSNSNSSPLDLSIPTVHYETVKQLLNKFTTQIEESVDLRKYPKKTSRELIKKISDVVWSNLLRSPYKDRAHEQTLYSYLNGNRLDCYGCAYAVVAACQTLGLYDVRLVMSEDHAWVLFGEGETCEVTWHGKGNEDRCGLPIPTNTDSWIFLNGNTMVCDRFITVATLVSAMNPSINATQDSEELAILQQQLLWILYDYGHLTRYPMALGNLGDLEDICSPRFPRKEPILLFREAIDSAKTYYKNSHVYPYTYLGGYYFRNYRFKEAIKYWADAAQVMKQYNYTRDDEEIYKEFQEIANDLIPNIFKYVSNRMVEPIGNSRVPLLQDAECFAYLIRFYDGLCAWEEGSSTPVLHIGWTKPLVATISKFSHSIRSKVVIKVDYADESDLDSEIDDNNETSDDGGKHHHHLSSSIGERRRRRAASVSSQTHECDQNGENGSTYNHHTNNVTNGRKAIKMEALENDFEPMMYHSGSRTEHEAKTWQKTKSVSPSSHDSDIDLNGDESSNNEMKMSIVAVLNSKKFAGLKHLLTADKLNTSAIQLQLTAQSQVNVNKRSRNGASKVGPNSELDFVSTTNTTLTRTIGNSTTHKRIRRE